jgi:predicted small lipoprotein YifL
MKICWAQYLQWAVFAVLALAILLSGCGQKGPLVLPDKAPAPTAKQMQSQ